MANFRPRLTSLLAAAAALAAMLFGAPALAVNQPAGHACMDYFNGDTNPTFIGCYSDLGTCQTVCRFLAGNHSCGFSFDSSTGKPTSTINPANDAAHCPITQISPLKACKDAAHGNELITCLSDEPLGDADKTCHDLICRNIGGQGCTAVTDTVTSPCRGNNATMAGNDSDTSAHACMDFANSPPLFVGSFNTLNQCVTACALDPNKVCGFSSARTSTGTLVGTDVINTSNDSKYGSSCTFTRLEDYPAGQTEQCDCYTGLFDSQQYCKKYKFQREVWTCGSGQGVTPVTVYKSVQKVYTTGNLGAGACTPSTQKDCSSYAWVCTPWSACSGDIQNRSCSLQKTVAADPIAGTSQSIDTIANPLDTCTYTSWDWNGGNESQPCGASTATCALPGHWACTPAECCTTTKDADGKEVKTCDKSCCTPEGRIYNRCTLDTSDTSKCADNEEHPATVADATGVCKTTDTGGNIKGRSSAASQLPNPLGITSVFDILALVIRMLTGVAGSIALLGFVYGGFELIISRGDPKKVQQGKEIIKWSVLGLVLMLGAYALANALFSIINQVASSGA